MTWPTRKKRRPLEGVTNYNPPANLGGYHDIYTTTSRGCRAFTVGPDASGIDTNVRACPLGGVNASAWGLPDECEDSSTRGEGCQLTDNEKMASECVKTAPGRKESKKGA